ncbi:radical SAM protein [Candidatus Woesearchaeota archaeon]|nr:MAG: radical SAM protein [Candidatus Woesearchaeota archaeon]
MRFAIVDCYTDEPSGLGVPPYLGVYPRYLAGVVLSHNHQCHYLRIDDLRQKLRQVKQKATDLHTDILTHNATRNGENAVKILKNADYIIVVAGIHTPGRYLSAVPGTLKEVTSYLKGFKAKRLLVGPVARGSMQFGGRQVVVDKELFKEFDAILGEEGWLELDAMLSGTHKPTLEGFYARLRDVAILGASIVDQIRLPIIVEIETGKGCPRGAGCSFCVEPLKSKPEWREQADILAEISALAKHGVEHFRLGKQSDFYSYKGGSLEQIEGLLKPLTKLKLKTLHIDNVDPAIASTERGERITQLIVKYCTPGNVAALGVESFDMNVIKANNLNSTPEQVLKAIASINKYGAKRGENGMPKYLPGINLLLGLIGENKQTLKINLEYLRMILDKGWLVRRINIRQVDVFPGTLLHKLAGTKYLKKNRKHYFGFRRRVREEIDHEMLKRVAPVGTQLRDVFMEVHRGYHTFGRQFGSYPLVVGTNMKLDLREFYTMRVTGHMLRSVIAVPC